MINVQTQLHFRHLATSQQIFSFFLQIKTPNAEKATNFFSLADQLS